MKASSGAALSAARACWSWEFFRFKRRNLAAPMEGDALFQRNHLFLRFLAGRAFFFCAKPGRIFDLFDQSELNPLLEIFRLGVPSVAYFFVVDCSPR